MSNIKITPELIEKGKGKTAEELVELAKTEGIELTDEQLETVSGGWSARNCPACGSHDVESMGDDVSRYKCCKCGARFN